MTRQLEDIKKLKGQIKKFEEAPSPAKKPAPDPRLKLNLQGVPMTGDSQSKLNVTIDAEGLNKKIIDSLSMQLDSIFSSTANTQDEELVYPKSPTKPKLEEGFPVSSDDEMLIEGLAEGDDAPVLEEKEKILSTFKQSVQ